VQLLLNAPWKERAGESEEDAEKNELLADRVGLYALTRAGYAPKAFSENLDRVAGNKGHTGSIFTDILGTTESISMRVRVARKIADSIPEGCKRQQSSSSAEFTAFQQALRDEPIHPLIDATPGLNSILLDPPMRSRLRQVRFSPDGKLILAQDASSIHVLSRSPLKLLFTIGARWAEPAHFTPDSAHVVFQYVTMRVEKWDVATGKRESSHELIDYDGCLQTSLSPDGRTFVCLSRPESGLRLKLSDVDSGKVFYDNKTFFGAAQAGAAIIVRSGGGKRLGTVVYTADGRTVLILAGANALAFDLGERRQIGLGKNLAHMVDGRAAFIDSDKLVYQCNWAEETYSSKNMFKLCEVTFPEGLPLNSFQIGYQWIEQLTRGDHLLIGPFKDNAAMLADPSTGKASAGFRFDSLDVFDQMLATENESGGLTVGELGGQHFESIDLPAGPMTDVEAAEFSPDGRYLAYSGPVRSSIWELNTRKRVLLMRPFRAVRIDRDDQMYAQYQGSNQKPGENYHIDLKTGKATETVKYVIDQFQRRDVIVTFEPLDKSGSILSNVNMQVADAATGAQLWSRKFPRETPLFRQSEDGTVLLIFDLLDDAAQGEANRAGAKLVKSSDTRGEWVKQGMLVQILDSHTGELRRAVQVPVRDNSEGGSGTRTAEVFGNYLVVGGVNNNSVIYRVSDGMRMGAFYGRAIAGDGKLGLIAATNRDQDVIVYDAATGKELKHVVVDHLPKAARFIPEKNALLVLTANQRVYTIDLPGHAQPESAQTH
jgi:WD40 repeat protein